MRRFFKRRSSDQPGRRDRRLDGPLRLPGTAYKHNGYTQFKEIEEEPSVSVPSCLSIFAWIYRHHAVLYARCREEGMCTVKQLQAIELIFIDGLSANEAARSLGISTQAVCDRMSGLATRCPPIYRWWRSVTEGRRRRSSTAPRPRPGRRHQNPRKA
jgi:hypothetical protein